MESSHTTQKELVDLKGQTGATWIDPTCCIFKLESESSPTVVSVHLKLFQNK